MKIINKIVNFVKENKIVTFALTVLVLSFVLLAIPGQFAHLGLVGHKPQYTLGGYEYIFNTKTAIADSSLKLATKISGIGLAGLIIMVLSFVALFFSKKSSFVTLCTGLALVTASIFFLAMEANAENIYPVNFLYEEVSIINWASYVVGALLLVAGGLVVYKSIMMMKNEVKHPSTQKGPYYNYLKK